MIIFYMWLWLTNSYEIIDIPILHPLPTHLTPSSLQAKLVHADQEVRLTQDPFPLYPGEALVEKVTKLRAVPTNTALRLRAIADFAEKDGTKRYAHDEWLFTGPGEQFKYKTKFETKYFTSRQNKLYDNIISVNYYDSITNRMNCENE